MKPVHLVPLLVCLALGVVLYLGLGNDPRVVPSPLVGKPAPSFELPELRSEGQWVRSSELAGKPYIVNVWASWCAACRVEHPLLMRFGANNPVPIVGLNWRDDPSDALRWLGQFGDPYDRIAADREGRVAIDFGVYGAPETFFVDAEGKIRHKVIGPLTEDVLRDQVAALLAPATGDAQPESTP